MIRGINKRIIEVTDTESSYFDRVLFFVKNDDKNDTKFLEHEARKVMNSYLDGDTHKTSGYLRYTDGVKKKKRLIAAFSILSAVMVCTIYILCRFIV